jgi:NAD(P)-dependent dehydrogenase (short-subunit alcohol dehydrogenase family)
MDRQLPLHWVRTGPPASGLLDTVRKGEYYTFQIALWSPDSDLGKVEIEFAGLGSGSGSIPASSMTCFNTEGIDLQGQPFTKQLNVARDRVQPLWCGLQVPATARAGDYRGAVIVRPGEMEPDTAYLDLHLLDEEVGDPDDNPHLISRLKWINSTNGLDNDFIARPFLPMEVDGKTIRILGREVVLNPLGLPASVSSWFAPEMNRMHDDKEEILSAGIRPEARAGGSSLEWEPASFEPSLLSAGAAGWRVIATCRSPAKADELNELAKKYSAVLIEELDVTDPAEIDRLQKKYQDQPLHLLINNAALLGPRDDQAFAAQDYDLAVKQYEVNALGPLRLSQAFIANVRAAGPGKIITLGSAAGSNGYLQPPPDFYSYRASKAAAHLLMHNLAMQLRDEGIVVGLVNPGLVDTRGLADIGPNDPVPEDFAQIVKLIRAGVIELTPPEESVAAMVTLIDGLTLEQSGVFLNFDGQPMPW